jgi:hypothetical protein
VFGEPAIVARENRGDTQREAFLAQQRVAAISRAKGDDLVGLGEVNDVLVLRVTGPRHVGHALRQRHADRVQAGHELAGVTEYFEGAAPHARHDAHGHSHVGRVGDLDADVRDVGAEGAHGERHDVHRAAFH